MGLALERIESSVLFYKEDRETSWEKKKEGFFMKLSLSNLQQPVNYHIQSEGSRIAYILDKSYVFFLVGRDVINNIKQSIGDDSELYVDLKPENMQLNNFFNLCRKNGKLLLELT